jgi:two-component system response regulator MprA
MDSATADMELILIVDDDQRMLDMVRRALTYEGYRVISARDGALALASARDQSPDLVVMDWMMPGLDGLSAVQRLRNADTTPVLMLTGRDTVEDKIQAFDAGVDDFLAKPFAPEELIARVRALLRRRNLGAHSGMLRYADLTFDPATREARRGAREFGLTRRETELLSFLMRHPDQVLKRDKIVEGVWGGLFKGDDTVLEVYVGYLRSKLEAAGEGRLIQTVRGVGYVLRETLGAGAPKEPHVPETASGPGA